jgi:hypothetical protein
MPAIEWFEGSRDELAALFALADDSPAALSDDRRAVSRHQHAAEAWVHESDEGMRAELSGRGYTIAESTLAMGVSLEAISLARPEVELGPLEWSE